MADIVPLRPLPKGISPESAVNQSVVDMLEKHLQEARRGEIASIAMAFIRPSGKVHTAWSSTDESHKMLGAIATLQYEYADR